jgi:hypothetical protein
LTGVPEVIGVVAQTMPVPVTDRVTSGAGVASNLTVPVAGPAAPGANRTITTSLAPGGRV